MLCLVMVSLLFIVCGAKDNQQQEVYYNQEQDGFYVRRRGTDKTGTKFAPYLGEPDNKQWVEKLEKKYTQLANKESKELGW